ncbi:uncharacterized protein BJX67DRAFT_344092 [Aspergillus lucknowensis]|uniref:Uncharacterized protein n=1 Tax=Aspergillus lucknowensis TaxID=176173 RepID=A0ABR4M176_9EURO
MLGRRCLDNGILYPLAILVVGAVEGWPQGCYSQILPIDIDLIFRHILMDHFENVMQLEIKPGKYCCTLQLNVNALPEFRMGIVEVTHMSPAIYTCATHIEGSCGCGLKGLVSNRLKQS